MQCQRRVRASEKLRFTYRDVVRQKKWTFGAAKALNIVLAFDLTDVLFANPAAWTKRALRPGCAASVKNVQHTANLHALKTFPTTELRPAHTLGQPSRRYRAEGFEFVLSRYRPEAKLPLHEHADSYICVNLSTAFLESSTYSPGSVVPNFAAVTHPAGEAHENHFDASGGMCLSIFSDVSQVQSWDLVTQNHDVSTITETRELGAAFSHHLQHYDRFEHCAALSFAELTLQLLRCLSSHAERGRLHLEGVWRALDAINDDPVHAWTTDELSRVARLHPTHLARQVKKITGQTFGEHLRRRRTLKAIELLMTRQRSVAEVAHSCGFADQSHLTRTVRRLTGVTPGALHASRNSR
jgi:AraC family transcriptional regulator